MYYVVKYVFMSIWYMLVSFVKPCLSTTAMMKNDFSAV